MEFLHLSPKIIDIVSSSQVQNLVFYQRTRSGANSKYKAYDFECDAYNVENTFKKIVIDEINKNSSYTIKPYVVELETKSNKNEIYELDTRDILNMQYIQRALDLDVIERITAATANDKNPNFYVFTFTKNENVVKAFTRYSPATVFKGKWYFAPQAVVYNEGLSIINSVHCLSYSIRQDDGSLIQKTVIFNKHKHDFEHIFDYKDDYKAKANLAIEEIKANKLLSNDSVFSDITLHNTYMIKKLAKIHLEKKISIVKEKFRNIDEIKKDFENFDVQVDTENAVIVIPPDVTKEYIENVLRILNTEFMKNIITEQNIIMPDNNTPIQHSLNFYAAV